MNNLIGTILTLLLFAGVGKIIDIVDKMKGTEDHNSYDSSDSSYSYLSDSDIKRIGDDVVLDLTQKHMREEYGDDWTKDL